jgi:hypothetical protein
VESVGRAHEHTTRDWRDTSNPAVDFVTPPLLAGCVAPERLSLQRECTEFLTGRPRADVDDIPDDGERSPAPVYRLPLAARPPVDAEQSALRVDQQEVGMDDRRCRDVCTEVAASRATSSKVFAPRCRRQYTRSSATTGIVVPNPDSSRTNRSLPPSRFTAWRPRSVVA